MTENNEKESNDSKSDDRSDDRSGDRSGDQTSKPFFPINREVIREDMVKTAINFLMNPRVRDSPLSQKRTFLLKKGLSLDEIDLAIDRSNRLNLPVPINAPNPNIQTQMSGPVQPMPSFMMRSTQFMSSVALFGCVVYGAYVLYKRFVEPLILGKQRKPHPFVAIQRHLDELSKAMSLLQTNISTIESNIKQQIEEQLRSMRAPEEVTLHELKSELASIKGLLVNRRQFAATPVGTIPLWQMNDNKETNIKAIDDSNQQMNGSAGDHNPNECATNGLTNGSLEATELTVNGLQD